MRSLRKLALGGLGFLFLVPFVLGAPGETMKLDEQDKIALGLVFDSLCKAENHAQAGIESARRAEEQKKKSEVGPSKPTLPMSGGKAAETPCSYLKFVEELSRSSMVFQGEPERKRFEEELSRRRTAFEEAIWRQVDTRKIPRARIQKAIDRVDLYHGNSDSILSSIRTSCDLAKEHGTRLLLELKSAEVDSRKR